MESRSGEFVRSGDFPVSLIMADCNYLKQTNDTLGHEYGDLLLKRVAHSIVQAIPKRCTAMRVGGDEFLILCPLRKPQIRFVQPLRAAKACRGFLCLQSAGSGCMI